MATIKIKREREFLNSLREYKIYIDGVLAGGVANGMEKEFPIPAGEHTISAKIDWCSSPNLVVNAQTDETISLYTCNFKSMTLLFLLSMLLPLFLVILRTITSVGNYAFLLLLLYLPILYYVSFGRNKYLTLIKKS